ncbi:MAG TPA: hypothetical protein VMC83_39475 [Streptosporangiaceae bacterium]|nr:hypothetical protein [Streptosporangiaceae bacterium]
MDPDERSTYAAAITAIERRKSVRDVTLRTWRFHDQVEQRLQEANAEMASAGWADELTRLAAHAPPDVLAALSAAEDADRVARERYSAWSALADQNRFANAQAAAGQPASFASSDATMAAFDAIKPALEAANHADDALSAVISAHLEA